MRWLLRFGPVHPLPRPHSGSEAYVRWTNTLKSIADQAVKGIMEKFELTDEKQVNHSRLMKHGAAIDDMPIPEGTPKDSVLCEKPKPRGGGRKRAREEEEDDDDDEEDD